MKATLAAEVFDWRAHELRAVKAAARRAGIFCPYRERPEARLVRPWVARITGRDPVYGLGRVFVPGRLDFSQANSTGRRGVCVWFVLSSGEYYEVYRQSDWQCTERFFCSVDGAGAIVQATREEVETWANGL